MAERKATNKYYPPEWDPKKGSINKFVGQHPLRDRARKLDQGILIVRFEMPFNVWCEGCKGHIGKGVRYNAEKKAAGSYFSSKIWNFRMKCHNCPNYMEIQTDPKNTDFLLVSGVKKKMETWEAGDENGTIPLMEAEEAKKLEENPFYRLEHAQEDTKKAEEITPVLHQLQKFQETRKDDYGLSCALRNKFRGQKKELQKQKDDGARIGIGCPLLPPSQADRLQAQQVQFRGSKDLVSRERKRKMDVKSSSIFATPSSGSRSNPQSETKRKAIIDILSKRQRVL